ncbi:MAG: J domain-containing protein [Solirubrobacterales bacterium]
MARFDNIDLNRTEYDKLDILETFDGDIEALRRNLAKRFHPDTGKEPNAARMKEINHACDILSNREQRTAYDDALRRERETARAEPAEERQAARPPTSTSSPPPPRPQTQVNLWWLPTLIPFVGPFVSWTYAAVMTRNARYRRWAWRYSVLVLYLILAIAAGVLFDAKWVKLSGAAKVAQDVFGYTVWFGPALHAFARRKEVARALASRPLRP